MRAHPSVHTCGQPVLTGLDGRVCALTVVVDPYRLTAEGEVAALRDDRRTYRIWHGELDRRDQFNIPGHPPAPALPVLAEHRCHDPVPYPWRAPALPPARQPAPTGDIPW